MEKWTSLDRYSIARTVRQRGRASLRRGFAVAAAVALSGCTIAIVSGPSAVSVGDSVTYVMEVGSSDGENNVLLYFAADVPPGWELSSASFEGTLDGVPTVFNAVPVGPNSCGSNPPTGLQAYRFQAGPFEYAAPDDTGTATLTFDVQSQPEEEFKIYFYFGAFGEGGGYCSTPAVRTINRLGESFVQFREAHFTSDDTNPVPGGDIGVAPDGRYIYLVFRDDDSLLVFARDPATGSLQRVQTLVDDTDGVDGLDGARGVVVSPDSRFVYVAGVLDDSLAVFSRDPDSGELTFDGAIYDGVDGVEGINAPGPSTLSPDGLYLYVAAGDPGSLAAFARDPASGELSFIQAFYDNTDGVDWLERPTDIAVSPDGRHVYVTSNGDDAVTIFARDAANGELAFTGVVQQNDEGIEGLSDPNAVAFAPGGAHVYVVSEEGRGSILTFARDPSSGELSLIEALHDLDEIVSLRRASGVAVSPDGGHVFVTGENSVTTFVRRPSSGRLTLFEEQFEGDPNEQTGFENTIGLAFLDGPSDDLDLYVASEFKHAVAVFRTSPTIFADGFESGDTSRWSEESP